MIQSSLKPGTTIGGHYLLVMPLGEKSSSSIWQAMDTDTGYQVALNFFEASDDESKVHHYLESMKLAQSIEHAHVVDVLDCGRFDDGTAYSSMELLDGRTLSDKLSDEQTMTFVEFFHVLNQALEGISALHKAGIIHGHIEQDSIFLQASLGKPSVKIIGMGRSHTDEIALGSSQEALLLKSLAYATPEQVTGDVPVSIRTDIYSLGIAVFEALAGKLPLFGQNVPELLKAILAPSKPQLSSINPDMPQTLSDVISRAISVDPAARPQSIGAFRKELLLSVKGVTEAVKKGRLPVIHKDAQLQERVMEWDHSGLGIEADPEDLDKNLVIQVQSKRKTAQPSPAPKKIPHENIPAQSAPVQPEPAPPPPVTPAPPVQASVQQNITNQLSPQPAQQQQIPPPVQPAMLAQMDAQQPTIQQPQAEIPQEQRPTPAVNATPAPPATGTPPPPPPAVQPQTADPVEMPSLVSDQNGVSEEEATVVADPPSMEQSGAKAPFQAPLFPERQSSDEVPVSQADAGQGAQFTPAAQAEVAQPAQPAPVQQPAAQPGPLDGLELPPPPPGVAPPMSGPQPTPPAPALNQAGIESEEEEREDETLPNVSSEPSFDPAKASPVARSSPVVEPGFAGPADQGAPAPWEAQQPSTGLSPSPAQPPSAIQEAQEGLPQTSPLQEPAAFTAWESMPQKKSKKWLIPLIIIIVLILGGGSVVGFLLMSGCTLPSENQATVESPQTE